MRVWPNFVYDRLLAANDWAIDKWVAGKSEKWLTVHHVFQWLIGIDYLPTWWWLVIRRKLGIQAYAGDGKHASNESWSKYVEYRAKVAGYSSAAEYAKECDKSNLVGWKKVDVGDLVGEGDMMFRKSVTGGLEVFVKENSDEYEFVGGDCSKLPAMIKDPANLYVTDSNADRRKMRVTAITEKLNAGS